MPDLIRKELIEALARARLPERVSEDTLKSGLEQAEGIISLVQGKNYSRVQGIGDDFIPDVRLYNALGTIYPQLSADSRAKARAAYLHQLDTVNYLRVQDNHTPFIAEPLALADIGAARPLYWPGLSEGQRLIREHTSFREFQRKLMAADGLFETKEVVNDFTVAYAALRLDISPFGSDYARAAHPQFLERVVEGIVTLRFSRVERLKELLPGEVNQLKGAEYLSEHKQGLNRLKELLPKEVHQLVQQKYESKHRF